MIQCSMLAEEKIEEAMDFLREHEPDADELPYYVGFSGGKDSIVTLDLVRRSGVRYEAYYSCTHIDPPEVMQFIRQEYPDVKWIYPKITFWQGIRKKGLPSIKKRWCCDVLKHTDKTMPHKKRVFGIRAEESPRRAMRGQVSDFGGKNPAQSFKPIFHWNEGEVWDYIDSNGLPYPSLYDEGFSRIGCIVCPFISGGKLRQARERWPKHWEMTMRCATEFYKKVHSLKKPDKPMERLKTLEEYLAWPDWQSKQRPVINEELFTEQEAQ